MTAKEYLNSYRELAFELETLAHAKSRHISRRVEITEKMIEIEQFIQRLPCDFKTRIIMELRYLDGYKESKLMEITRYSSIHVSRLSRAGLAAAEALYEAENKSQQD